MLQDFQDDTIELINTNNQLMTQRNVINQSIPETVNNGKIYNQFSEESTVF